MTKKYILKNSNLKILKNKIRDSEKVLLFLDYDGSLAPFNKNPMQAFIVPKSKECLKKLRADSSYQLSLVSGRKLSELKKIFPFSDINYAGSHGLELELSFTEDIIYPYQDNKIDKLSRENYSKIKEKYQSSKEVEVEDKGFGLAFHLDSQQKAEKIKAEIEPLVKNSAYELLAGRKIIEIRPQGWDKGKAVNYITKKLKQKFKIKDPLRIYIGDDSTDEDAFEVLEDGLTIYVQNDSDLTTKAEYYLKDPKDTAELLAELAGEL